MNSTLRFKDLKEKRKYNNGVCEYTIVDGGLYYINGNRFSDKTMEEIIKMKFEEIKPYVSFEKAMEYMLNTGNRASFDFELATVIYRLDKYLYEETDILGEYKEAILFEEMVAERKWILLEW